MKQFIILSTIIFMFSCTNTTQVKKRVAPGQKKRHSKNLQYKFITAQSGLRIRQKPDTSSRTIGLIPFKERVTVLKKSINRQSIGKYNSYWYKIKYQNTKGWVYGAFIADKITEKTIDFYIGNFVDIDNRAFISFLQKKYKFTGEPHYFNPRYEKLFQKMSLARVKPKELDIETTLKPGLNIICINKNEIVKDIISDYYIDTNPYGFFLCFGLKNSFASATDPSSLSLYIPYSQLTYGMDSVKMLSLKKITNKKTISHYKSKTENNETMKLTKKQQEEQGIIPGQIENLSYQLYEVPYNPEIRIFTYTGGSGDLYESVEIFYKNKKIFHENATILNTFWLNGNVYIYMHIWLPRSCFKGAKLIKISQGKVEEVKKIGFSY